MNLRLLRSKFAKAARGRTCLDCGFLTTHGKEVRRALRVSLERNIPSVEDNEGVRCSKRLWVDFDLSSAQDKDVVFFEMYDELERSRRRCGGFFKYEPGFDPAAHLQRQEEVRKEHLQWRIAKLGFVGALFGGAIGVLLVKLFEWLAATRP